MLWMPPKKKIYVYAKKKKGNGFVEEAVAYNINMRFPQYLILQALVLLTSITIFFCVLLYF